MGKTWGILALVGAVALNTAGCPRGGGGGGTGGGTGGGMGMGMGRGDGSGGGMGTGGNAADAFARTAQATGTPAPMPVIVWPPSGQGEPAFAAPGTKAQVKDGNTMELGTGADAWAKANGLEAPAVTWTLTLSEGGSILAGHTFTMQKLAGNTMWLVADPAATDPNGSFTPAFAQALVDLGKGSHELNVKLFAEGAGKFEAVNEATIVFDGNGGNGAYAALVKKLGDAAGARSAANAAHMSEQEATRAAEAAERDAKRSFTVDVKNADTGHTKYLIVKHDKTLSEEIKEVGPGKTITLSLFRGSSFTLLVYDQDQGKDAARKVAQLDESRDGSTITVQ